jgi:hypothetical protein
MEDKLPPEIEKSLDTKYFIRKLSLADEVSVGLAKRRNPDIKKRINKKIRVIFQRIMVQIYCKDMGCNQAKNITFEHGIHHTQLVGRR